MIRSLLLLLALQQPQPELNVEYAKIGEQSLQMDIYRPAPTTKPMAAVVVIHGGGWMSGKRQDMAVLAKALSENGMFAATVSYRLAPKDKWPAMLDDVQTAVRYLRANAKKYNIDPNRIGAGGASAGGQLALMLGLRDTRDKSTKLYPTFPSRVSAVFDMFGPTDIDGFPKQADMLFPVVLGKTRDKAAQEIIDASPILFVDKKSAPVFIYQGLADPLVNPKQSQDLEAKYKSLGLTVESVYLEGVKHEFLQDNPKCVAAVQKAIVFLKKYLKVD
jgi:acetyl esterase/lipase